MIIRKYIFLVQQTHEYPREDLEMILFAVCKLMILIKIIFTCIYHL